MPSICHLPSAICHLPVAHYPLPANARFAPSLLRSKGEGWGGVPLA